MASSSRKKINFDPYEVLSLRAGCTKKDIDQAYRKKSRKWHPDKNPDNQEKAQAMFIRIKEAYDFLSDEALRLNFDEAAQAKMRRAEYDRERSAAASAERLKHIARLNQKEAEARAAAAQPETRKDETAEHRAQRRQAKMEERERKRRKESATEAMALQAEAIRKRMMEEAAEKERARQAAATDSDPIFFEKDMFKSSEAFATFEDEVLKNLF